MRITSPIREKFTLLYQSDYNGRVLSQPMISKFNRSVSPDKTFDQLTKLFY